MERTYRIEGKSQGMNRSKENREVKTIDIISYSAGQSIH